MDEDIKMLLESMDNRLKWLLQLKFEEYFDEDAPNKEKVQKLYQMGFSTQEMAEVIGTSPGSIRGTLSQLRNEGEIE